MDIWIYLIVAFVVLDLLFVGYIIYVRKRKGLSPSDKKKYQNHWKKIKGDNDFRHAIMGADKLLDVLLQKKGYSGALGEKLKRSESLFSDYNGIWSAHKLRNRIAHELDVQISYKEAHDALRKFERALRDLGLF